MGILKNNNEITNISKKMLKKRKRKRKNLNNQNNLDDDLNNFNFSSELFGEIEDINDIDNNPKLNKHIAVFIDGENISSNNCLSEIKKFNKNEIEMVNVYGVNTSYYRNGKGKLMIR